MNNFNMYYMNACHKKKKKFEIHSKATPSKKHPYYQTNHHASYHRRGKLLQLFGDIVLKEFLL